MRLRYISRKEGRETKYIEID